MNDRAVSGGSLGPQPVASAREGDSNPQFSAKRDGALLDDWAMNASEDYLRDRINAADEFRLTACKDYNTKLDALASTGAEAQEIERLRTVCEDAKIRFDRVTAGGQFIESVDEALAILPAGASMVVDPNRVPLTVQEVQRIPEADSAILVRFTQFGELNTVQLDDIISVEYFAVR